MIVKEAERELISADWVKSEARNIPEGLWRHENFPNPSPYSLREAWLRQHFNLDKNNPRQLIKREKEIRIDIEGLPLEQVIEHFQKSKDELGDLAFGATLEIEGYDDYGSIGVNVTLQWKDIETESEYSSRCSRERYAKQRKVEEEKKQLALLKARYEGEANE